MIQFSWSHFHDLQLWNHSHTWGGWEFELLALGCSRKPLIHMSKSQRSSSPASMHGVQRMTRDSNRLKCIIVVVFAWHKYIGYHGVPWPEHVSKSQRSSSPASTHGVQRRSPPGTHPHTREETHRAPLFHTAMHCTALGYIRPSSSSSMDLSFEKSFVPFTSWGIGWPDRRF